MIVGLRHLSGRQRGFRKTLPADCRVPRSENLPDGGSVLGDEGGNAVPVNDVHSDLNFRTTYRHLRGERAEWRSLQRSSCSQPPSLIPPMAVLMAEPTYRVPIWPLRAREVRICR